MTPCLGEHLEGYVEGALPSAEAEAVFAHLRQCDRCTKEVSWLRTERRLLSDCSAREPVTTFELGRVRRHVLRRVPQIQAITHRRQMKERAFGAGRALLSASAAVVLAFVFASLPPRSEPLALASLAEADCMSREIAFCGPPTSAHERVAAVEDAYDACLVATPRQGPDGLAQCW